MKTPTPTQVQTTHCMRRSHYICMDKAFQPEHATYLFLTKESRALLLTSPSYTNMVGFTRAESIFSNGKHQKSLARREEPPFSNEVTRNFQDSINSLKTPISNQV